MRELDELIKHSDIYRNHKILQALENHQKVLLYPTKQPNSY